MRMLVWPCGSRRRLILHVFRSIQLTYVIVLGIHTSLEEESYAGNASHVFLSDIVNKSFLRAPECGWF